MELRILGMIMAGGKGSRLEPDTQIGYDLEADSHRYFISEKGVVVSGGRTPVEISRVAL